jgi:hypothetical protein
MNTSVEQVKDAADIAGINLYKYDGSRVLSLNRVAETLTAGLTHYFASNTRRFHKSRVVMLRELHGGLALGFVESVALNYENTSRGYRPGFIDADGEVFDRPGLDASYKTKAAAVKEFWRLIEGQKPVDILANMLQRKESSATRTLASIEQARALLATKE